MNEDVVINLGVDAVMVALKVALPILLVALVVGLAISIFQAITQIQEMTLTFIPKILALVVVIIVAGPWMLCCWIGARCPSRRRSRLCSRWRRAWITRTLRALCTGTSSRRISCCVGSRCRE